MTSNDKIKKLKYLESLSAPDIDITNLRSPKVNLTRKLPNFIPSNKDDELELPNLVYIKKIPSINKSNNAAKPTTDNIPTEST